MDRDGFKSTQKGKDNMNTLITWNQLREMEEAAQNRFNRFLGGFPNRMGNGETHSLTVADWSPEVDISQDEQGYLLKADLPEMKKEDVRVTVEDGILCVSGERKTEKEDQKKKFHRIERSFGTFRRSFTLPEDALGSKVTADFRDGVLKVHLPTTTIAKSKAIEVKVQ
jgi:HSP20 family protein